MRTVIHCITPYCVLFLYLYSLCYPQERALRTENLSHKTNAHSINNYKIHLTVKSHLRYPTLARVSMLHA